METPPTRAIEDRLIEQVRALGIAQARIAAGQNLLGLDNQVRQ